MAKELPPSYDSVVLSIAAGGESSTDPDEVARIHSHGRNQSDVHSTRNTAHRNTNTEIPSQYRSTSPNQIDTRYGSQYSNQKRYGHSQWPGMDEAQALKQSHSKTTYSTEGFHPYYAATREQFRFGPRPRWDETPTSRDEISLAARQGIRFEPVQSVPPPTTNKVEPPKTCYNKYVPCLVGFAFFLNMILGGIAIVLLIYKTAELDGKPGKEKWVQFLEVLILAFAILGCCSPLFLIGFFTGWY